jgi:N-methylhydantoinase A
VTLEKGEDPRFYTLLPFGGAGGMVAPILAERLGIQRILIPPFQGVFSAVGLLVADYQKEFSRSILEMYSIEKEKKIQNAFKQLEQNATRVLLADGFDKHNSAIQRELDIRYQGQSFEITVPYQKDFIQDFHDRHQVLYSYCLGDEECEIVNARVLAIGRTREMVLAKSKSRSGDAPVFDHRKIYYNGRFRSFFIYRKREIFPGCRVKVPAIAVSDDSTVLIDQNYRVVVDEYSNIIMTRVKKQ